MRVVFVLRSAEIFPAFLRFVLPFNEILKAGIETLSGVSVPAFFCHSFFWRNLFGVFPATPQTNCPASAGPRSSALCWWRFDSVKLIFLIELATSTSGSSLYRSHFGSRYPFRLKRLASLFVCVGSNPSEVIFNVFFFGLLEFRTAILPVPWVGGSIAIIKSRISWKKNEAS